MIFFSIFAIDSKKEKTREPEPDYYKEPETIAFGSLVGINHHVRFNLQGNRISFSDQDGVSRVVMITPD